VLLIVPLACGQLGQSYQDYHCSDEEKHMECPVDKDMSIVGVTHAKVKHGNAMWYLIPADNYHHTYIMKLVSKLISLLFSFQWYGAPGPMRCGPKTDEQPFSGFWDYGYECESLLLTG
jgi:hypothetical protein